MSRHDRTRGRADDSEAESDSTDADAGLGRWGVGLSTPEAPHMKKKGSIRANIDAETSRIVGYHGISPERECRAFVTSRDSDEHRLRALDAYAISDRALSMVEAFGIERIYIVETDTGTVYEFRASDYLTDGDPVPEEFLMTAHDPQTYRRRDEALHRWRDHAGEFYIPRDVDVAFESEFSPHGPF